jgi:hypothetical protein
MISAEEPLFPLVFPYLDDFSTLAAPILSTLLTALFSSNLSFHHELTGAPPSRTTTRSTALAVWEMKSLTEGTAQVMEEIVEMGLTDAKFPWKKCTLTVCNHRLWEGTEGSRESYDAGFDPGLPPWTLPIGPVPSASTANSRPTSLPKSLRSASAESAQGETTVRLSYMSPVENGEGVREKKRRNDSDASEYEPLPKKSKADLMDGSYEPPPVEEMTGH